MNNLEKIFYSLKTELLEAKSEELEEFVKKLNTNEMVELIRNDKNFKFETPGSIITYLGYKNHRGHKTWIERVRTFLTSNNLKLIKKSETFMTCSSCGKKFPYDKNKRGEEYRYCKECYENGKASKHSAEHSHDNRPPQVVCGTCGKTLPATSKFKHCQDCIDKNPELKEEMKKRYQKGAIASLRIQGDARRSYNERKFAEDLKQYFEAEGRNVSITTNEPVVDFWDADVFIKDLNIAIFWNGKYWHDKPKQANRDRMKIERFKREGITIYSIEDPSSKSDKFVKSELKKFVEYLKKEIYT